MPRLFINKIKKTLISKANYSLGDESYIHVVPPQFISMSPYQPLRIRLKKCLYPSSITGAPVAASPLKDRCKAQRLASINNFYSFSAAGALCKKFIYLLFSS
jgi:hypothetical protein